MGRRRDNGTLDLFEWEPPEVEVSYAQSSLRLSGIEPGAISRAVSHTLTKSKLDRERIRQRMEGYLGQDVSLHMLNNWASESKVSHSINLRMAFALVRATNDPHLLSLGLEGGDFAIVPRRHLADIEKVFIDEKIEELQALKKLNERRRKGGGR